MLKDADGKDFNLASQKGKVILLDFWATWCPPCKVEIPWFVEFQRKYGPQGFIVIGVSVDDPAGKLKPFGQQYKVNYPLLVGEGRNDIKGPRGYNAAWGLPKTFVIGRDGKICKTHIGLPSRNISSSRSNRSCSKLREEMQKGFTHARLACGCRVAFREGIDGSPYTVVRGR